MRHAPDRLSYALQTARHNPSEMLRILRVALKTFWFRYAKRCVGSGTLVGEKTVFINSANISFGNDCLIADRVYIRAGANGKVSVGDGAAINSHVQIFGHGGVRIGEHAQIGPGTVITTTGHNYRAKELEREFSAIDIGKRAWIGANATILPGVSIGDFCVIGAGAVVNRDIPPHSLAVGVPARVIRSIEGGEYPGSSGLHEDS